MEQERPGHVSALQVQFQKINCRKATDPVEVEFTMATRWWGESPQAAWHGRCNMDFVGCVNLQHSYVTLVFLGPFWSTGLQTFCTLHRRGRDLSRCCSAPLRTASGTPPCSKGTRETVPHASVPKRCSQIDAGFPTHQIVIEFVFSVLGHHIMRHTSLCHGSCVTKFSYSSN